eukprot:TRINITY_DN12937_c0_g1_i1.p1 TRINITY_DN12937_c0_g1~~TRINITY_DN12937_c0_g1_i1.p1  ORF type:complete len:715 (-),score=275.79 TRINITY_DN12937_c0_g1_i1:43-2151(-)
MGGYKAPKKVASRKFITGKKKSKGGPALDPEMYHDVDEFMEQRDRIRVGGDNNDASSEDEDEEVPVFGLKGKNVGGLDVDSSDEDESSSEGEGSDSDDDAEFFDDSVKKKKNSLTEEAGDFGSNRSQYYGDDADVDDVDDDDEEEEAIRLQKRRASSFRSEDFDEYDSSSDEDDDEDDDDAEEERDDMASLASRGRAGSKQVKKGKRSKKDEDDNDDIVVKMDPKAIRNMTTEEKLDRVITDAPELLELLEDFRRHTKTMRTKLAPLLERTREMGFDRSNEGISFLEAKYQLLLSYCVNICYYLTLKAEGEPVKDHPVIERLVEIRTILEKIRPLDKKLKYQTNKLLKRDLAELREKEAEDAEDDELNHRANLDGMRDVADEEGDEEEGMMKHGGAVPKYRPSKVAAVHYDEDGDSKEDARRARKRESLVAKAKASGLLQVMGDAYGTRPETMDTGLGEGARLTEEELHKQSYEEENFMRFPVTKAERRSRVKRLEGRESNHNLLDLDDFGDVGKLLEDGGNMPRPPKKSVSQHINDYETTSSRRAASADTDLPYKENRHKSLVQQADEMPSFEDQHHSDDDSGGEQVEVESYMKEVKENKRRRRDEAKEMRKKARFSKLGAEKVVDREEGGRRHINRQIEKNRGLVPRRKKELRNSRVKHRNKYEAAKKKIGTQHRKQEGSYSGEASGLRTNVTKSISLAD